MPPIIERAMSGPQIFMFHLGFSFATLAGTAASISAAADIVLLILSGSIKERGYDDTKPCGMDS